jgi:hypothetical protein
VLIVHSEAEEPEVELEEQKTQIRENTLQEKVAKD